MGPCETGPHNPHPPPASLTRRDVKRCEGQLSAIRSMDRTALVHSAKRRLQEFASLAAASDKGAREVVGQMLESRDDIKAIISASGPSRGRAASYPDTDVNAEKLEAERISLEKKLQEVQERNMSLQQALSKKRAWRRASREDFKRREDECKRHVEKLQAAVSDEVLSERRWSKLAAETAGFDRVDGQRTRSLHVIEALERHCMERHDDVVCARGLAEYLFLNDPIHNAAPATQSSPEALASTAATTEMTARSKSLAHCIPRRPPSLAPIPAGPASVVYIDVPATLISILHQASSSTVAALLLRFRHLLNLVLRGAHTIIQDELSADEVECPARVAGDEGVVRTLFTHPKLDTGLFYSYSGCRYEAASSGFCSVVLFEDVQDAVWFGIVFMTALRKVDWGDNTDLDAVFPPQHTSVSPHTSLEAARYVARLQDLLPSDEFVGVKARLALDVGECTRWIDPATLRIRYRTASLLVARSLCQQAKCNEFYATKAAHEVLSRLPVTEHPSALDRRPASSWHRAATVAEKKSRKERLYKITPLLLALDTVLEPPKTSAEAWFSGGGVHEQWWAFTGQNVVLPWAKPLGPLRVYSGKATAGIPSRRWQTADLLSSLEGQLMRAHDVFTRTKPPGGELTLVFTDVQGSTSLWDAQVDAARLSLKIHNDIMRRGIELFQGYEVRTEGDAFMVAFQEVSQALNWCIYIQRALLEAEWPEALLRETAAESVYEYDQGRQEYVKVFNGFRVRMGFNVCVPDAETDQVTRRMGYFGPPVNLVAMISSVGQGGETVIGAAAYQKLNESGLLHSSSDVSAVPLGSRKFKDISKIETVYQILPKELVMRRVVWEKETKRQAANTAQQQNQTQLTLTPVGLEAPEKLSAFLERVLNAEPKQKAYHMPVEQKLELMLLWTRLPRLLHTVKMARDTLRSMEANTMHLADGADVTIPPSGFVTVVFSDIQGSPKLWETEAAVMKDVVARHSRVVRVNADRYSGYEVKTEGDAFMHAFDNVLDALGFCSSVQTGLLNETWPAALRQHPESEVCYQNGTKVFDGPRVRMCLNSGHPKIQKDPATGRMDYTGPLVNLTARLSACARGGEIVAGFSAFSEITRLDEERGGSLLASYSIYSKGEMSLKALGAMGLSGANAANRGNETLHAILPKAIAARWHVWGGNGRRLSGVETGKEGKDGREAKEKGGSYWTVNAGKLEKGKLGQPRQKRIDSGFSVDVMLSELGKRTNFVMGLTGDESQRTLCFSEMSKIVSFSSHLYSRLMTKNGHDLHPCMLRPRSAPEQQVFVKKMKNIFLAFLEDEQTRSLRVSETTHHSVDKPQLPVHRPSWTRVTPARVFSEAIARRLVNEFSSIDGDNSGSIHLNEILSMPDAPGLSLKHIDEKSFKRFDKDRDGVINILEVFRVFFPTVRVPYLQAWLVENAPQLCHCFLGS
ncbi:Adenylate cyclase [Diplonema papillatum]|nr:Adenylate cyclase [Diplonema papillatum]